MRQLSISVYFVGAVLKYAVARGLDPVQLLRQNRISPRLLEEDDARISIERFADLQVSTMLAMGDEGLGYSLQRLPVGTWSMMCYAVIHCETLGQALARYCRFFGLFQHSTSPRFVVAGDATRVRIGDSWLYSIAIVSPAGWYRSTCQSKRSISGTRRPHTYASTGPCSWLTRCSSSSRIPRSYSAVHC